MWGPSTDSCLPRVTLGSQGAGKGSIFLGPFIPTWFAYPPGACHLSTHLVPLVSWNTCHHQPSQLRNQQPEPRKPAGLGSPWDGVPDRQDESLAPRAVDQSGWMSLTWVVSPLQGGRWAANGLRLLETPIRACVKIHERRWWQAMSKNAKWLSHCQPPLPSLTSLASCGCHYLGKVKTIWHPTPTPWPSWLPFPSQGLGAHPSSHLFMPHPLSPHPHMGISGLSSATVPSCHCWPPFLWCICFLLTSLSSSQPFPARFCPRPCQGHNLTWTSSADAVVEEVQEVQGCRRTSTGRCTRCQVCKWLSSKAPSSKATQPGAWPRRPAAANTRQLKAQMETLQI